MPAGIRQAFEERGGAGDDLDIRPVDLGRHHQDIVCADVVGNHQQRAGGRDIPGAARVHLPHPMACHPADRRRETLRRIFRSVSTQMLARRVVTRCRSRLNSRRFPAVFCKPNAMMISSMRYWLNA